MSTILDFACEPDEMTLTQSFRFPVGGSTGRNRFRDCVWSFGLSASLQQRASEIHTDVVAGDWKEKVRRRKLLLLLHMLTDSQVVDKQATPWLIFSTDFLPSPRLDQVNETFSSKGNCSDHLLTHHFYEILIQIERDHWFR